MMKPLVAIDALDPHKDHKFLTPEELADLLTIPKKTLAHWRSERKGPMFYRMGVHVRYPESSVHDWLDELDSNARAWMAS